MEDKFLNLRIIHIDLRRFNQYQLIKLCEELKFDYFYFKELKDGGIASVWVDLDSCKLLAVNTKKDPTVQLAALTMILTQMKSVTPTKKTRSFNIDDLLDKINQFGIESLKKDEKEFLDNLSKK